MKRGPSMMDHCGRSLLCAGMLNVLLWIPAGNSAAAELELQNVRVPFCYQPAGSRSWRIVTGTLTDGQRVELELLQGESSVASGANIDARGLIISVTSDGRLQVTAGRDSAAVPNSTRDSFRLRIRLVTPSQPVSEQIVVLRPAPSRRPIGYVADLVDDLIHTFYDAQARQFQPVSQGAFDQYFRRLQAHGVHRLIVWHSPFPYFTRPQDHAPEHWQRYASQARAIIDSEDLENGFRQHSGLPNWMWLKFILALRMNPDVGPMFVLSAAEHGISLTVSFEPFESALTKYYEVPAFDQDGTYLWGFLPLAVPAVNYRPADLCFAHYRQVLRVMGHPERGRVAALELSGLENVAELKARYGSAGGFVVRASEFPPIASDSFVLQRQADGSFRLVRYESMRAQAESHLKSVVGLRLELGADGTAGLTGGEIPLASRCLWLTHPQAAAHNLTLDREFPVRLRAPAGNRLERETTYWAPAEEAPGGSDTRIAGIGPTGEFRTVFQANQNSITHLLNHADRVPLAGSLVVVDSGPLWSVEMLDFQQAAARQLAVTQIKTLFSLQAAGDRVAGDGELRTVYDEIFINTRSHVDLATTVADGVDGQKPIAHYYRTGRQYLHHLGLDKAYAPRSSAADARLQALESTAEVERITAWQDGEWRDPCQEPDSPFVWRMARNQAVADGITQLLRDLEREFPGTRVRAVIPPREATIRRLQAALDQLPAPNGGFYGRDYYRQLWCSNNHIPTIGEGMAMVDLGGTKVEPVFLGSGGYLPDDEPFRLFLDEQIRDLADNRGSAFRGPRSYFFEAQSTLRAADPLDARRRREEMICELLRRRDDIGEVLLYEATDWLHWLPLDDADYCSHAFTLQCVPGKP